MKARWVFVVIAFASATPMAAGANYLYFSNDAYPTPAIYQVSPSGNVSLFASGPSQFGRPWLASDGSGRLFANEDGELYQFGNGNVSSIPVDSFNQYIAADASGDVFLANLNNDGLSKRAANGQVSAVNLLVFAGGLAADPTGNLYFSGNPAVGDAYNGYHALGTGLYKVDTAGNLSAYSTTGLQPNTRFGQLAVDPKGDLFAFYGLPASTSLVEVTPAGNVTTLANNLNNPSSIALGTDGTVYVSEGLNVYTVTNGTLNLFAQIPGNEAVTSMAVSDVPVSIPEPKAVSILGVAVVALLPSGVRRRTP